MKKYLSVFTYFMRSNIYKLLIIITSTAIAQSLAFSYILKSDKAYVNGYLLSAEYLIETKNIIPLIFAVAFITLTAFICLNGMEFSSKTGYTVRRLRISEKETIVCNTASNIILYLLLYLAEIIIAFSLCFWHFKIAEKTGYPYSGAISNQSLFLSFYRSCFLHSLMPLSDILRYVTNIISIISMGISAAAFPYLMRRKKFSFEVFIIMITVCINFTAYWQSYSPDLLTIGICCTMTGIIITRISSEEQAYEK